MLSLLVILLIIYGCTNDPTLRFGLNLCVILAKYYIYTAYIWQAFFAFLQSYLDMEMDKSKFQVKL